MSCALYSLRQVKKTLNSEALLSLYTSTIHSHLIYGIQIWGGANKSTLSELFKKQKHAIRVVCNSNYNAHTEPLLKKWNILPLPDLVQYFNLQFMHNFKFSGLPSSFELTWRTKRETRQNPEGQEFRSMRDDEDYHIPGTRTTLASSLPLATFPKTWNELEDPALKEVNSKALFSKNLKEHFLNKLKSTPSCNRANYPNC